VSSTAQHYRPNLRDIFFNLFEVLEIQSSVLGKAPFESMDEDTARTSLEGFLEVLQATWAPGFVAGDRLLQRRLEQARAAREPRWLRCAAERSLGRVRADGGRQPGGLLLRAR
jgi:hypothetical protein